MKAKEKMSKVMLIDDDSTMKLLLQTLLEMEGYQVVLWDVGTDVLSIMRVENPDILLLDVNLKGIDGFDVLNDIRADDQLKDTKVIMSSGMDFSDRIEQERADDFILKPYMPEDLINKIRKQLN